MAIFEITFNVLYLLSVIIISAMIYINGKHSNNKAAKLFGLMGLLLGFGDSFHLIPRIFSHVDGDFEKYAYFLGMGKLVTSVTMTFFYVILFKVYELMVKENKNLRYVIYAFVVVRLVITFLPGNEWALNQPSLLYPILRNIPFAIIGGLMIIEFWRSTEFFKKLALWILVSFVCYIIVVVGAYFVPVLGAFMMPKTVAYLLIVFIGYKEFKRP